MSFFNNKKKITTNNDEIIRTTANTSQIALLANGKVAKTFLKEINLPWDEQKKPVSIIYGNKQFGYFTSDKFNINEGLSFQFIPPTYKSNINFCIKYDDGTVKHSSKKQFQNPSPVVTKNVRVEYEGEFNSNYFLIGAQFVPNENTGDDRAYIPIIVNKVGEVVWAHLPQNGKVSFKKYPTVKPIAPGEYGIMFGEKQSYFERFNYKGDVLEYVFPKLAETPYIVHHDFVYLGDSKILTLGHKLHYVRNWFALKNNIIPNIASIFKPASFLSTTIDLVDLKTNSNKLVWDPMNHFNPLDGVPWARNTEHAKTSLLNQGRHFSFWGQDRAQVDWTHANTIEYYKGTGILVSLRNMSKVVLIDENSHDVLWTLGNSPKDTYQTLDLRHSFYHQHHAHILDDGKLMMMDNHSSPPAPTQIGSRVLIYGLNNETQKAQVVWNYQPQKAVQIGNRGSAYQIENKNVIAFYPASLGLMDHLIEVDRKTGQPLAHMKIYFTDVKRNFSDKQLKDLKDKGITPFRKIREGGGNRAIPLNTIGIEKRASNVSCKI